MAEIIIYIGLQKGSTTLLLRDSNGNSGEAKGFVTHVMPGDVLLWQLEKGSAIDALQEIKAKSGRFTLFEEEGPAALDKTSWKGRIRKDAEGTDSYDIAYQIKDRYYREDPEVSTKPPGP